MVHILNNFLEVNARGYPTGRMLEIFDNLFEGTCNHFEGGGDTSLKVV